MSEESITNPPEPAEPQGQQATAPAAPPDDPGDKRLTQDEVNALIARERRKWERKAQAKKDEPQRPAADEDNPVLEQLKALQQELQNMKQDTLKQREDASFEAAIAGIEGLSPEDRTALRGMFDGKNAAAVRKFAGAIADHSQPDKGVTGRYVDPGAGVAAANGEPPSDPLQLTRDDVSRLQEQGRLREHLEKAYGVGPQNKVFRPKGFGKGK